MIPAWATRINTLVQARLHSEKLRLTQLAQDTIGDIRPETLRRMWAAEGVPMRLALGRSGDKPAEQVTVERAKDGKTSEASAAVRLDGRRAGHVTSGAYGHTLGASVALAWIHDDEAITGERLAGAEVSVEVRDHVVPAEASVRPFYDPDGKRLRG